MGSGMELGERGAPHSPGEGPEGPCPHHPALEPQPSCRHRVSGAVGMVPCAPARPAPWLLGLVSEELPVPSHVLGPCEPEQEMQDLLRMRSPRWARSAQPKLRHWQKQLPEGNWKSYQQC